MAFGDRLRMARARAGLSLAGLADRLDNQVTAQAINKYELGKAMPSSSTLVGLSKALGVSLDFLMANQVVELEGIEFRKRANTTEKERAFVEAEVIDHVERYLAIEEILELPINENPLRNIGGVTISELDEAEDEAYKLREKWNLGCDPIPSMTALLEERDIRVIAIDLPEKFSGLTCWAKRPQDKPAVPVVVVSTHFSVERERFTLAHELAHAVIGNSQDGKLEKAMDRFAAAFLIPADHLRNELGQGRKSLAYQELVRLKHFYGVSMWALLMRLKDVGVISDAYLKNLYRTPARAWLKEEPEPLSREGDVGKLEIPQRFELLVYRAVTEGLIPTVKAAALLKRSVSHVEQAVKGPH